MAPVLEKIQLDKELKSIVCNGQHREILDQILEFYELEPEYDLKVMSEGKV